MPVFVALSQCNGGIQEIDLLCTDRQVIQQYRGGIEIKKTKNLCQNVGVAIAL